MKLSHLQIIANFKLLSVSSVALELHRQVSSWKKDGHRWDSKDGGNLLSVDVPRLAALSWPGEQ